MTEVKINTPFIKLEQLLKFCGAAGSGGEAKISILTGWVSVNREICLQRGRKLFPGDIVCIEEKEFLLLNSI